MRKEVDVKWNIYIYILKKKETFVIWGAFFAIVHHWFTPNTGEIVIILIFYRPLPLFYSILLITFIFN